MYYHCRYRLSHTFWSQDPKVHRNRCHQRAIWSQVIHNSPHWHQQTPALSHPPVSLYSLNAQVCGGPGEEKRRFDLTSRVFSLVLKNDIEDTKCESQNNKNDIAGSDDGTHELCGRQPRYSAEIDPPRFQSYPDPSLTQDGPGAGIGRPHHRLPSRRPNDSPTSISRVQGMG